MLKTIGLLKRKPGMSVETFRHDYETRHRLLGEKYLRGHAARYMRRYLEPVTGPSGAEAAEADYDVVLEIWYPDRAAYDAVKARLSEPEVAAEIADDEERLFDRAKNRFFIVAECESDL